MIGREFFDKVYDRRGSDSVKYNSGPAASDRDVIPMWVADMDFKSPPAVEEALVCAAKKGIYGYENAGDRFDLKIRKWYKDRMGWDMPEGRIFRTPGVMYAAAAAIRALTEKGEHVMIFQPVYYPFLNVIRDNGRVPVISELRRDGISYVIDFDDAEKKIRENDVRILLFCSPHNPVGRVWKRQELERLVSLCSKEGVRIISDEIHSDFILEGSHIPLASLSEEADSITVTCVSPTKTFNIPGLNVAGMVSGNKDISSLIKKELAAASFWNINIFAEAAAEAAYENGAEWLDALLDYLKGNVRILEEYFPQDGEFPHIRQEGTYLSWIDMRALGLKTPAGKILEESSVWLHEGSVFGQGGEGYVRMNIACPESVLRKALERIQKALARV